MSKKKEKGFTLSEVLVALIIISVIMAMMIPTLMKITSNRIYTASLQRNYLILKQAYIQAKIANGGIFPDHTGHNGLRDVFVTHLNVIKKCNTGSNGVCMLANGTLKTLHNSTSPIDFQNDTSSFVLRNMSLWAFKNISNTCAGADYNPGTGNEACGTVYIDVNGFKKPNVYGRDVFSFLITKSRIIPHGSQLTGYNVCQDRTTTCNPASSSSNENGCACTSMILDEGAMNY